MHDKLKAYFRSPEGRALAREACLGQMRQRHRLGEPFRMAEDLPPILPGPLAEAEFGLQRAVIDVAEGNT